jgi:hypothetical protein
MLTVYPEYEVGIPVTCSNCPNNWPGALNLLGIGGDKSWQQRPQSSGGGRGRGRGNSFGADFGNSSGGNENAEKSTPPPMTNEPKTEGTTEAPTTSTTTTNEPKTEGTTEAPTTSTTTTEEEFTLFPPEDLSTITSIDGENIYFIILLASHYNAIRQ